jgi:predicted amidohydrolase YtcJ
MSADTILHNAKIATNGVPSFVEALAITDGKIAATGAEREIFRLRGTGTKMIDGKGRTIIPGLNDSHIHPIRGGLNYNMELRWDGVPSLADALQMLKDQAAWLAVGQNFNSQSDACQRSTKSMWPLRRRPSLFCTYTIGLC